MRADDIVKAVESCAECMTGEGAKYNEPEKALVDMLVGWFGSGPKDRHSKKLLAALEKVRGARK